MKVIRFLAVLAALVALTGLLSPEARSSTLEQDFQVELERGITMFFQFNLDEGMFVTLHGSKATLRYLDGEKADGSLLDQTDTGSFTFSNGQLTLHSDALARDLQLKLEPVPPEYSTTAVYKNARYRLEGFGLLFGGIGPVEPRDFQR